LRLDEFRLENFRNYERLGVVLAPGVNLVVGRNAQGKTNLLEAVYCLSGLGSPRGADATLVREGAERAVLHARVVRGSRSVAIDMEVRPGRTARALINRTAVSGVRELGEVTAAVFFGPDELSLIKGSPEGRRRFVDDLVVKLRPARDGLRREWDRVLRQRNALLRSMARAERAAGSATRTLEVWNEALCRVGASLTAARLHALALLAPHASRRYSSIAGGGSLNLAYESAWLDPGTRDGAVRGSEGIDEEALYKALGGALTELATRELERGVSLAGPQRDDVIVGLAAESGRCMDARAFASQGDQRTAALALKLAESDLLTEALGERPILLLDDVFSELDPSRRSWLAGAVKGLGQVVLSSAEPGAIDASRADRVVEVEAGRARVRD
jgi:DNA replication and repair protein RecF